jgi:hypothetical protein
MDPAPRNDYSLGTSDPAAQPTPPPTAPKPRFKISPNAWTSSQWGLASILFNGFIVLAMPITTVTFTLIPISIRIVDFWDREAMTAASIMMVAIPAMMIIFSLIGLVFGFSGWFVASARKQPQSLHVAGSLLAILALILWIGTTVVGAVMADGIWNITRH